MPISTTSNLAAETIANEASIRLYESFPFNSVSHAQGTRTFVQPIFTTANTGSIAVVAENAAQASESTFQPTLLQKTGTLETYRASVLVSNELLTDSAIFTAIAQRLSGQISEKAGNVVVANIAASLVSNGRFTLADAFPTLADMSSDAPVHVGFDCMSNLSNIYRDRASWVFSKTGYRSYGDMEGRASLITLPISDRSYAGRGAGFNAGGATAGGGKQGGGTANGGFFEAGGSSVPWVGAQISNNTQSLIGSAPAAGGGGGGGGGGGFIPPAGGVLEESNDPRTSFRNGRNPLVFQMQDQYDWLTAWLGSPIHTSDGLGNMATADAVWMMLVDFGAYLHFSQPLTISLDTESKASNNQTVIHASYRCSGSLLEPTAGYAIRHGAV